MRWSVDREDIVWPKGLQTHKVTHRQTLGNTQNMLSIVNKDLFADTKLVSV